MIPALYLQHQATTTAIIAAARNATTVPALRFIQNNDIAAGRTFMDQVDGLRARFYNLFAGDDACIQIALRTFYMSEIFPLLKQTSLGTLNESIINLEMHILAVDERSSPQDEIFKVDMNAKEIAKFKLMQLNGRKIDVLANNNRAVTGVFKTIMYTQNGINDLSGQLHPKSKKRGNTDLSHIDKVIGLFANELFDPYYIRRRVLNTNLQDLESAPEQVIADDGSIATQGNAQRRRFNEEFE